MLHQISAQAQSEGGLRSMLDFCRPRLQQQRAPSSCSALDIGVGLLAGPGSRFPVCTFPLLKYLWLRRASSAAWGQLPPPPLAVSLLPAPRARAARWFPRFLSATPATGHPYASRVDDGASFPRCWCGVVP